MASNNNNKKFSEEFDKDGFLYKRTGKEVGKKGNGKWKVYYINLIGGALHYYKQAEDSEPKVSIELGELKMHKDHPGVDRKFVFILKNDKHEYVFSAEDDEDYKEWVGAIEANMSKTSCPPLKKEKRKSRARDLAFKAKKNVVGNIAMSPLGKKALRGQAPEEVRELVSALKEIVERESKSSKKASEIEENIFKMGIKCYFLIEDKRVTFDDLLTADKPLRQGLELLAKCHDHAKFSTNPNMKLLHEKLEQGQKYLQEAGALLTKLLEAHLKAKSLHRIKETVDYLGNADRLLKIFQDESLNEPLQELISASEHYTQFHFYPDAK